MKSEEGGILAPNETCRKQMRANEATIERLRLEAGNKRNETWTAATSATSDPLRRTK
jgi:hypothetical protein